VVLYLVMGSMFIFFIAIALAINIGITRSDKQEDEYKTQRGKLDRLVEEAICLLSDSKESVRGVFELIKKKNALKDKGEIMDYLYAANLSLKRLEMRVNAIKKYVKK